MSAEILASLIGQDVDAAAMYLEMAGGDIDIAVSLYFETVGDSDTFGASSGGDAIVSNKSAPATNCPDWLSLVWPQPNAPLPAAWADQTLTFDRGLCLPQLKNGSCGVIAAWQAVVIATCHRRRIASFFAQGPHFKPPPALLASALADLLRCCLPSTTDSGSGTGLHEPSVVRVCHWAGQNEAGDNGEGSRGSVGDSNSGGVKVIELDVAALDSQSGPPRLGRAIGNNSDSTESTSAINGSSSGNTSLRSDALASALEPLLLGLLDVPGACALLVYSALLTRGAVGVRNDMASAGTDAGATLVTGPMSLCSLELVSLLLAGRAHGHCLAYHPLTRVRHLAWARPDARAQSSNASSATGLSLDVGAEPVLVRASGQGSFDDGSNPAANSGEELNHSNGSINPNGKRAVAQDDDDDDAKAERGSSPPVMGSSLGVGFLSVAEKEAGQPIADDLKSPNTPVWVLHGGDHFTVLFDCHPLGTLHAAAQQPPFHHAEASHDGTTASIGASIASVTVPVSLPGEDGALSCNYPLIAGEWRGPAALWHWNGLPPAGPRLTALTVTGPTSSSSATTAKDGAVGNEDDATKGSAATNRRVLSVAKAAPSQLKESHVKPRKGQIEDVVQARPADKAARPFDVASWTFEVVLADPEQDDDDNKGADSHSDSTNVSSELEAAVGMDIDDTAKDKQDSMRSTADNAMASHDTSLPMGCAPASESTALTQVANSDGVFQQEAFPFTDPSFEDTNSSSSSSSSVTEGTWRCRRCYATRFKTFCFGINLPTATSSAVNRASVINGEGGVSAGADATAPSSGAAVECVHCGILRFVGGWSVWMPYSSLPPSWQAAVASRYGPPVVSLLRSKWPNCEVAIGTGGHGKEDKDNADTTSAFPTV